MLTMRKSTYELLFFLMRVWGSATNVFPQIRIMQKKEIYANISIFLKKNEGRDISSQTSSEFAFAYKSKENTFILRLLGKR